MDSGAGVTFISWVVVVAVVKSVYSWRNGDRRGAARRNSNGGSTAQPGATVKAVLKA